MRYLLILVVSTFIACDTSEILENEDTDTKSSVDEVEITTVKNNSFPLKNKFGSLNLDQAKNIGEFYDHRLRFFEIKNPDISFYKTPVKELVLYFIDSTLVKLRYELEEEVGSYLLDSLGMSKFKPLDSLSKALIVQKKVYNKLNARLNPELKNYELIWRDNSSVRKYRVKNFGDSLTKRYFYHEMYGYKKKVKELEVLYYYLEEAIPVLD